MADSSVAVTSGVGTSIDTRTEATNGHHRQVIVIGDPSTNAGVAPVDATNGLAVDVKASALPTGAATSAKQDTIIGHVDGIEGLLTTIDADTSTLAATDFATEAKQDDIITAIGNIPGGGGTQYTEGDTDATITGTVAMVEGAANAVVPMTQPLTDTQLRAADVKVTLDSESVAVTGTFWQATQPVSGTVTANLSATDNAVLDDIAADTESIKTAVETIDNAISGSEMQVDVLTMPTVTVTATNLDVQSGGADLATSTQAAAIQTAVETIDNAISGNEMQVDVLTIAAGDNNIGNVDIASIAAGDNNIGNVDIVSGTVTTVSTLTGGGVAHDSSDSGNPHKIGFKAYSPDGTTPGTAVAEGDRTDAKGDLDGRLYVSTEHPRWGSYHADGSSALTDATVAADPGDGFQVVITNISFSSGAATAINMFLEEGSTKIFGPIYLEAVAGRGFCTPAGFRKHVTASTAVTVTTSAAIAHSVDIQYEIVAV